MKIIKNENTNGFTIDTKRFYIPFTVEVKCKCGHVITRDLSCQYLDYPVLGRPFDMNFWCVECDHEFSEKVELKVDLVSVN